MTGENLTIILVVLFCVVGIGALLVNLVIWTINGVLDLKERIENNRSNKR